MAIAKRARYPPRNKDSFDELRCCYEIDKHWCLGASLPVQVNGFALANPTESRYKIPVNS
jgi:hypothetical protein